MKKRSLISQLKKAQRRLAKESVALERARCRRNYHRRRCEKLTERLQMAANGQTEFDI